MRALPRLLNRQAVSLPVLSLLLHGPVGVLTVVGAAVDAEDVVGILERVSEHRLHCARPSVYHRTCWCRNSVWPAIRPIPGGCSRFWHPTGSQHPAWADNSNAFRSARRVCYACQRVDHQVRSRVVGSSRGGAAFATIRRQSNASSALRSCQIRPITS